MSYPKCIVHQPAGIGDILYTYQLGFILSSRGYEVVWPIIDQYSWLPKYIDSPSITFISNSEEHPFRHLSDRNHSELAISGSGDLYVPLSRSTLNSVGSKYPLMLSKYAMLGLEQISRNWHNFISIKRNSDRENMVRAHYAIESGVDYIFCNSMIGSPDGHLQELPEMKKSIHNISETTDYRIIENYFLPGTTLFDFIPVLIQAKELHLPNSALAWLAEWLAVKGLCRDDQRRFCYPRDLVNSINYNYRYMKGCWDESNWFFVRPQTYGF